LLAFTAPALGATVFTVAGRGGLVPLGEGGPAMSAGIETANGLAVTADGGFLVIDGPRIRVVAPDGRIATVAGASSYGYGGGGGPAIKATLGADAVAVMPDGSLLVADTFNNDVRRVWPDGHITTAAGRGGYDGPLPRDGTPATIANVTPRELAVAPNGDWLIA